MQYLLELSCLGLQTLPILRSSQRLLGQLCLVLGRQTLQHLQAALHQLLWVLGLSACGQGAPCQPVATVLL